MILFKQHPSDHFWEELSTEGAASPLTAVKRLLEVGCEGHYRLIFVKDDGRLCDEQFDIERKDNYVYRPVGERGGVDTD